MPYNKFSITTKKKKEKNISKDMPTRKRKNPLEFQFCFESLGRVAKNILRLTELVNIISSK